MLQECRPTSQEQAQVMIVDISINLQTPWLDQAMCNSRLLYFFNVLVTCFFFANRPKHPLKMHVWAGISLRGPTCVCIFEDCIDADLHINILRSTLLPFIHEKFPVTHWFQQENDPKHTLRKAKNFIVQNGINWWVTPSESPDCKSIELLWHELKEDVWRETKPVTKRELADGIKAFWSTVIPEKWAKYIRHLNEGHASGH